MFPEEESWPLQSWNLDWFKSLFVFLFKLNIPETSPEQSCFPLSSDFILQHSSCQNTVGRPPEQRVAWRWNAKQICRDKRMCCLHDDDGKICVFSSVYMDFSITSKVFATRVNRQDAEELLVRFSRDHETEKENREKDRGWDIKEEREWWGWAGTCFLTDPNMLAANLPSYQQWNTLQLSPFVYINLITKKYNHLKRHTSGLLYVNNPASIESQNYVNYYSNHPKWGFRHLPVTQTCRCWPQL